MKPTQRLHDLGQSLWLGNSTRDLLSSGTLKHYMDELWVTGPTSDLTIFDQAIKKSSFRHLAKTTCGIGAVAMNGTRSTRRGKPSVTSTNGSGWTEPSRDSHSNRLTGGILMSSRISMVVLTLVILGGCRQVKSQSNSSFDGFKLVDNTGNIRKPDDYRDLYQVLGAYTVLDPKGDQMHFTYASPGTAEYYRKNGKFADGTVLVKEVFGADHAQMTTGDAHWAAGTKVWFVLIKDAKGRFPNNPLWGDGWGWALFKSDAPDKQVATDHKKDCLPCHVPARADDWIYVKGYPVLHSK